MQRRLNFSALNQISYPASWGRPRFHFGQQVLYLGVLCTVTGLRYCQAFGHDDAKTPAMEWHYELDGTVHVPAEVLESVLTGVAA